MNVLIQISIIVLVTYFGLTAMLYLVQRFFLFHPEKLPEHFQFRYDFPFEEVFIEVDDGSRLNGIYLKAENPRGVVFYFKGNTRSVKGWGKFSADFVPKGWDFFMVDYPGFGKSKGLRSESRIYHDMQIAWKWLRERHHPNDIVIYGRSLGAGFAACIASWNHPRMLILDSPYFSFLQLANRYAGIFPLRWILRYRIPLYKFVRDAKCPVYILHGDQDRLIPYKYSLRIQAIDPDRIHLITIPGGHHNDLPQQEAYQLALEQILNDPSSLKTQMPL